LGRAVVNALREVRLGSMAVNTYGRFQHPGLQPADDAVMASLTPDNLRTRAIILSDVATAKIAAGGLDADANWHTTPRPPHSTAQILLSRRLTAPRPRSTSTGTGSTPAAA